MFHERMCEIIYWAHGVKISRDILYKFRKDNFEEFTSNIGKTLKNILESLNIEFSDVLSYDKQYVKVMGEWMYKLTAMDSVTGHVYDFCVATKDEFDREYVKNFLKPLIDEYNINIVVTYGDNMYTSVLDELDETSTLWISCYAKSL